MANENLQSWTPDVPVPPGETLRETLEERGITQVDFAVRLGKSEKFVSQLVNGKAALTHETALDLERVLGVPSSFWNAAESQYRDLLAREAEAAGTQGLTEWAKAFPVKEMAARGWIAMETSPAERGAELLSFFGVSSIEAYSAYWGSERRLAARMSTARPAETAALAAWLRAGEIAAETIQAAPYNESRFRETLETLRFASRLSPLAWQDEITTRCAACGVVVVFIRDLPKTRCHAVSWWATPTRAVIQLGLRYMTDDQVWFSLYHEAGHLLLDSKTKRRVSDLDGDELAEAKANQFAADTLIPPAEYARLRTAGRISSAAVQDFAARLGIAPGIVVGRMQNDGVIPHSWLNSLKVRLQWAC